MLCYRTKFVSSYRYTEMFCAQAMLKFTIFVKKIAVIKDIHSSTVCHPTKIQITVLSGASATVMLVIVCDRVF
jgi:hypothetical protein